MPTFFQNKLRPADFTGTVPQGAWVGTPGPLVLQHTGRQCRAQSSTVGREDEDWMRESSRRVGLAGRPVGETPTQLGAAVLGERTGPGGGGEAGVQEVCLHKLRGVTEHRAKGCGGWASQAHFLICG